MFNLACGISNVFSLRINLLCVLLQARQLKQFVVRNLGAFLVLFLELQVSISKNYRIVKQSWPNTWCEYHRNFIKAAMFVC
jgi:hypothetical protein